MRSTAPWNEVLPFLPNGATLLLLVIHWLLMKSSCPTNEAARLSTVVLRKKVCVRPPVEYYAIGADGRPPCLWRLNKAVCPLPWQEHFACKHWVSVVAEKRPNLYCHSSRQLYVLAYLDDFMVRPDLIPALYPVVYLDAMGLVASWLLSGSSTSSSNLA